MNFTQQQAIEALKVLGVQAAEIVDDESKSDFNMDTFLQTVDAKRAEILKPKWQQEIGDTAEKEAAGKLAGVLTARLAALTGMKRSDLDKIEKLSERVDAAIAYKNSLHEGDAQQVEAKIQELVGKHNQTIEELQGKYNQDIEGWKNKYVAKEIGQSIYGKLKDAPILDTADKLVASGDFQKHLADKFNLSYDEASGEVKLFSKANPAMPALNEAGTAPIDLLAEAKNYFTPRGLWQTNMKHKDPVAELAAKTGAQQYTQPAQGAKPAFADKFNQVFQGDPVAPPVRG